jgi:hypothetical protein
MGYSNEEDAGWNDLRQKERVDALRAEIARLRAALYWATKFMTPSAVSRDPEFERHRPTLDAAIAAHSE